MTSTASIQSSEQFPSMQHAEKASRFDIELLRTILDAEPQIDEESGLKVVRLDVKDGYENYPGRSEFDAQTAEWQDALRAHPEWKAPERPKDVTTGKTLNVIPRNPVSQALYGDEGSEARKWGMHMPDSYALWNLYHPEEETIPDGTLVTPEMKTVFEHLLDARGIRIRGNMIEALGVKYAEQSKDKRFSWISHGGGAFAPAMHAVETIGELMPDTQLNIRTYDLDEDAMNFGMKKAEERGLTDIANFETCRADFRHDLLANDSPIVREAIENGGATFVENSGLTEYFADAIAIKLIKNGYESTAPGGGFVFSNMRDDRDQLDLNQRGVGWNKMHVRSLTQLRDLMVAAEIDPNQATVYLPADGLYAIVEIPKPEIETKDPHTSGVVRHIGRAGSSAAAA